MKNTKAASKRPGSNRNLKLFVAALLALDCLASGASAQEAKKGKENPKRDFAVLPRRQDS